MFDGNYLSSKMSEYMLGPDIRLLPVAPELPVLRPNPQFSVAEPELPVQGPNPPFPAVETELPVR